MSDREARMIARIERQAGLPGLADALAERIAPTDLQSLLLHVSARRAAARVPSQLLADREREDSMTPSQVDARDLHAVAGIAFAAAAAFDAVQLAPVCPLGTNSVLGTVDPRSVLATVRTAEVLADPTTAHALECALRRRQGAGTVRLCSSERVLRLQPFGAGFHQHFHLFALTTGGRAQPGYGFELEALREHLQALLDLAAGLAAGGRTIRDVRVEVADATSNQGRLQRVQEAVFPALRARHPDVELAIDHARTRGRGYYDGLMLDVTLEAGRGRISVADGGTTDWLATLRSDRRERLFTSGIGLDRLEQRTPPIG